ncbi:wax ester/triacylglycerol synthase domain-containing protein [Nocardia miyunensis]|uniref:wax ester/triacylglycerol synthase domain-containing protein n=1 Tax=Nocardia miyunensis TaxID=282684 RepID=UPI0008330A4D|nr:wax ester/triacylglycerol synthase domain-containing protein [Nocardia miyunensis]
MGESNDRYVTRACEQLRDWGRVPELNPLDALMWRTERSPANSWAGLVVKILDSAPEWDRVVKAHRWAMRVVPRFTERVVDPLIPTGPPVWSPDPNFDLSYHLRRIGLPAPGSMRQLLEIAQAQAVVPLDRNRPPWMGVLVEGLEGGRAAYLLQCHHVLMDGAGATQLFSRILGKTRDEPFAEVEDVPPRENFDPVRATVRGLSRLIRSVPEVAGRAGAAAADASRHPGRTVDYVSSMARVAKPVPGTSSELLQGRSRTAWRFGMLECELADLKKAGAAVGGTVNDAYVAATLGGLRAYHAVHGKELGDVPISMPVSVRRENDPMGGNRFAGAFFLAPSGVADPGERVEAMHERVTAIRGEPALDFMGAVTPLLNFAPSGVVTATLQNLTSSAVLTTSSWPGLTEPRYMAGARFDRMFVFGPLPGTSMCAALCSHLGICCIGLNVDGEVFPDTDVLWQCMQQGLDEILALAT